MDLLTELGQDMVDLWLNYWPRYLIGIRNTVILAIVATALGCLIGFICGILNTIPYSKQDHVVKRFFVKLIRVIVRIYVEVFRGTPMVLQAVFIFYGLPYFTHSAVAFSGYAGIWTACIIVVSINTGAYMAETVRGGIISIDPGQTEGAKAIGMNHVQTMTSVILPRGHFHQQIHRVLSCPPLHKWPNCHVFSVGHHRDDRLSVHDAPRLVYPAPDRASARRLGQL